MKRWHAILIFIAILVLTWFFGIAVLGGALLGSALASYQYRVGLLGRKPPLPPTSA